MFHPTPWHFWPVLTIAFVWHLVGVIDYTATQFEFDFWMQMASTRQENFIDGMPDWIDGSWALAVWLGLAGVLLTAFRASFAPLVLALSFIAMVVLTVWLTLFSLPTVQSLTGATGLVVLIGSCVAALLLWLYARAMHQEGVIN